MLRPKVFASERLMQWLPVEAFTRPLESFQTQGDVERARIVLAHGWDSATLETYGTGLLLYHVWCDERNIPDEQRTPISTSLLSTFLADCAGAYSKSALKNAVAALHAWSLLHDVKWNINQRVITGLLKGSAALADDECARSPRLPVLLCHLELIAADIDRSLPFDIAWLACALTVFWGTARLGEFVIPTFNGFEPGVHITPKDVHVREDPNGLSLWELRVPRTKTARDGEVVCFAPRPGPIDPEAALRSHLAVNQPSDDGPLFAFRRSGSSDERSPMTRHYFLSRLKTACDRLQLGELHGHSFRIGSTLQLLLEGVSFETVKIKGRWKSEAFQTYLREHGAIMAQYIQEPELQRQLVRVSLPAPR
jgi:hypothetical protein